MRRRWMQEKGSIPCPQFYSPSPSHQTFTSSLFLSLSLSLTYSLFVFIFRLTMFLNAKWNWHLFLHFKPVSNNIMKTRLILLLRTVLILNVALYGKNLSLYTLSSSWFAFISRSLHFLDPFDSCWPFLLSNSSLICFSNLKSLSNWVRHRVRLPFWTCYPSGHLVERQSVKIELPKQGGRESKAKSVKWLSLGQS